MSFKLDKLSHRLSKIQADNQLRFQHLENQTSTGTLENKDLVSKQKEVEDKILPGSSEPQDLGAISYKDSTTKDSIQQTQSVDTTSTVVSEIIKLEEKILPDETPEKQYEFASSFLKVGD